MSLRRVDIAESFARFKEPWSPKIVGELNGQMVKLVRFQGEFVWHRHEHEDEMFLVVPRGVEHRPVAEREARVMLFEPATTLNTGDVRNERTLERLERL
jgi:mannose-6-phosphate isomerase-like protein (cupin superfamily)